MELGVVAQLARPMAFNQSCYGIRGKQGFAETNFVYYALRHAVSQMQQVAHGGVFNTITRDTFKIIKTNLRNEFTVPSTLIDNNLLNITI